MKLIIGLGNPGPTYQNHRHTVGFHFCDFLANKLLKESNINVNDVINFEQKDKFRAELFETKTNKQHFIFAKPQTYMNLSGKSVKKLKDFYKIQLEDIIVAHDELDIPLGKFKVQQGGGSKIHNGLRSIETELGNRNIWMIRIGIENRDPTNRLPGDAFVLQDFTLEEKTIIEQTFEDIYERMKLLKMI